jgi:ABC-type sugar transport system substrate-binding protein
VKMNKGVQIGAVVTATVLLAAACSSSKKSGTAASSPAPAATTAAPAATTAAPTTAAASSPATTAASSTSSAAGTGLIGVDYPRSDTDFWNSYISYVPKFATTLNATIKTTNSQNNIQTLVSNVQALIGEGAKAIVMAPQDTAAIGPELAALNTKNIPVVSIDTRPDTGNVYMVVRADNVAYGTKACQFLGTSMKGTGSVVVLEGDTASINGRDRTTSFMTCMSKSFPNIKVHGEPAKWDGPTAASDLQTALTQDKNIRGIYMESSFALAGTLQVLSQDKLTAKAGNAAHIFIVSNDGIPQELADIKAGLIDATVSQPADQYAKYGLYYAQAALAGKTFAPGPTDHNSNIIQVRPGVLEDQLSAPLVTLAASSFGGGVTSIAVTDTSLWGNNAS